MPAHDAIDSTLTRHEVKSNLLQGFWATLERETDARTVSEIIALSGIPEALARDRTGWLSFAYYEQLNRLVVKQLYVLEVVPGMGHAYWDLWRHTPSVGESGGT